jgi:hypothetical protein
MAYNKGNKPPKDNVLSQVSAEHFKRSNKKIANKSKAICEQSDIEKVRNGTHKWLREGRTTRLIKIETPAN